MSSEYCILPSIKQSNNYYAKKSFVYFNFQLLRTIFLIFEVFSVY